MKVRRLPLRLERLEDRSVPANFSVTSLADTDTNGTLRWAINQANTTPEDDSIDFTVSGTLTLQSALPTITGEVRIQGLGTTQTIIEPDVTTPSGFTPFLVTGASGALLLQDLTLANGRETSNWSGTTGVRASNGASLTIIGCVFRDHATYYNGVVSLDNATATIESTWFTGTTTSTQFQQRGVIHNYRGDLLVENSTFSDNTTRVGGIILTESTSTARADTTLRNVTIANNTSPSGPLNVLQVGGTINTTLDIEYSTIANNSGRAITNTGSVTLLGNIFANSGDLVFNVNGGSVVSEGYNIADTSVAGVLNQTTDLVSTNPQLGTLADHGGPVPTFSLLPNSPAIDRNDAGTAPSTDARGVSRSHGADSGAFESQYDLIPLSGDGGFAQVLNVFASPLAVGLTDEGGDPVVGQTVQFTILSGSATFVGQSGTASAQTQANGVATSPLLVAGTVAGTVTVEARVGNLVTTFTLTVLPGATQGYRLEAFVGGEFPVTQVDPDQPFTLVGTPIDAYGNVSFEPFREFNVTSTDPLALLPVGPVPNDYTTGLVAIGGLRLYTPGQQTLTLTEDVFLGQTESGGSTPLTGSLTLTVTNQPPDRIEFEIPPEIVVGQNFTLSGSFEDVGDNRGHEVWIFWGDGNLSILNVPAGSQTFSTEFAYSRATGRAPYELTVIVYDADRESGSVSTCVSVTNIPPQVNAGGDLFLNIGERLFREILISHPSGGPYRVFVDYGDGTPEVEIDPTFSGEESPPQFFLDHVYQRESSFLVTVRVVESEGGEGFTFFFADVLLPGIDTDNASKVTLRGPSDQTGTVSAPGVNGLFFRSGRTANGPRDDFSSLIVATVPLRVADSLDEFPPPPIIEEGKLLTLVASYDVRGVNIDKDDFAIVTFTYRNDDLDPPILRFFDNAIGQYVIVSPSLYNVDPVRRRITIRLDENSVPRLQDLFGTVFTISVQLSLRPPTAPIDPGGVGGAGGGGVFTANVALVLSTVSLRSFGATPEGQIASGPADNGPGRVDGKAVNPSDSNLYFGIGGGEEEPPPEGSDWLRIRVRGEGALDDLPAPPADAVALPGVTLSPAEPRLLETLPATPLPSLQTPSANQTQPEEAQPEEETASAPSPAREPWEPAPFSPDALFGDAGELDSIAASPALFVPLLGAWEPRPSTRKRSSPSSP